MAAPIEPTDLTFSYGKRRGISDHTVAVRAGEIFGFLGPNGAGKTTTVRQLLGPLRPAGGSARVFGLDCWRDAAAVKGRAGGPDGGAGGGAMNFVMLRRALKDLRWTVAWYAGGLGAFVLLMMGFYPTVREHAEEFQRMLSAYPEPLMKAFGVTDFTTMAGFMGAEVFSALWPLIVAIFVILAGAATVALEIERGTVDLWLSVPERRWRLLLAKVAALLTGVVLIMAITLLVLAGGAAAIGERFALSGLLAMGVVLASFGVAVGGYAVLCSSFSGDRGKAAGLAAALTLAFSMAYIMAELSERWAWLERVTIFTAYQPQRALETGQVPLAGTLALLAIGVAGVAVAATIFERLSIVA